MLEPRRDQHYFRRRGDVALRRSRKRRSLRRRIVSLAGQAAVLVGVYALYRQAHTFFTTSSIFRVRTIAVRGNHKARTADILALSSGVLSENIFRVDLPKLCEDLRRSPWVLDVAVRRALPDTIEVTIQERAATALVCFEGRTWLVDATGRRLAEYGPDVAEYDFPVLTGIEGLPRPEAVRRIRSGAAAVSALCASAPELAKRISELDLSSPDRIEVRRSDGAPVLLLDTRDYLRNLDNYAAIQRLIERSVPEGLDGRPQGLAYVDLRFRGRIAVMPKTAEDSNLPRTF